MFTGLYTAIITPFTDNGEIDIPVLYQLIDRQIDAKVDGLVILGTTGESPTISTTEHDHLIDICVKYVAGRCKVIAGTGSNATREAIHHSLAAQKANVDGLLIVNPYYNKPTQKGMYQHFLSIADAVSIPIILYNIEGRTGVNLETQTLVKLANHPNIIGVKEASGNLTQIQEVINATPDDFVVLAGDDGITMEVMKMGGHGTVSVLSNLLPVEMLTLVQNCKNGQWKDAMDMHISLGPLFDAAFIETNPQPVKTLMAEENLCKETFRLPLTTMEDNTKTSLLDIWGKWKSVSRNNHHKTMETPLLKQ